MMKILIAEGGSEFEEEIAADSAELIHKELSKYNVYSEVRKIDDIILQRKILEKYDFVYIISYGGIGENGSLQSILQNERIPYSGSISTVNAICKDKYLFNKICDQLEIKVPKFFSFHICGRLENFATKLIDKDMQYPIVIKPRFNGGSSFGVVKVNDLNEVADALFTASKYDEFLIVQEYIEGIDYISGVMRNNKAMILPIGKTVINKDISFTERYKKGTKLFNLNKGPLKVEKDIKSISIKLAEFFEVSGMVYIDYRVINNVPYLIELGTMYGISQNSIIPHSAKHIGLNLIDLIEFDISQGLERSGNTKWRIQKEYSIR